MLKPSDFINIVTGEDFTGEFPEKIYALATEEFKGDGGQNLISATKMIPAKKGDTNYDDVLPSHLLRDGYVLKSRVGLAEEPALDIEPEGPSLKEYVQSLIVENLKAKGGKGGKGGGRGNIEGLAKHFAHKYGGDPHLFTKIIGDETLAGYDEEARNSIAARAHYIDTGIWPGAHGGANPNGNEPSTNLKKKK